MKPLTDVLVSKFNHTSSLQLVFLGEEFAELSGGAMAPLAPDIFI